MDPAGRGLSSLPMALAGLGLLIGAILGIAYAGDMSMHEGGENESLLEGGGRKLTRMLSGCKGVEVATHQHAFVSRFTSKWLKGEQSTSFGAEAIILQPFEGAEPTPNHVQFIFSSHFTLVCDVTTAHDLPHLSPQCSVRISSHMHDNNLPASARVKL